MRGDTAVRILAFAGFHHDEAGERLRPCANAADRLEVDKVNQGVRDAAAPLLVDRFAYIEVFLADEDAPAVALGDGPADDLDAPAYRLGAPSQFVRGHFGQARQFRPHPLDAKAGLDL